MKNKLKIITAFIIGVLISEITVYGAGKLYSNEVEIDKNNGKLSNVSGTKLQDALDYLYAKASTVGNVSVTANFVSGSGDTTYLAVVYLNPKNLSEKCYKSNSVSKTGTKEGCMKWYIFAEDTNNYTAILDHNTTDMVSFSSTSVSPTTMVSELNTKLVADIAGWDSGLSPRLITADEVAKIVGADILLGFSSSTSQEWFYFDGSAYPSATKWQTKVAE